MLDEVEVQLGIVMVLDDIDDELLDELDGLKIQLDEHDEHNLDDEHDELLEYLVNDEIVLLDDVIHDELDEVDGTDDEVDVQLIVDVCRLVDDEVDMLNQH